MIKVCDRYSIQADERNYIVVEHYINRKGEPTEKDVAFCSTIENAMRNIYSRITKQWVQDNEANVKETLEAFTTIANEIMEYGKQLDFPTVEPATPKTTLEKVADKPKQTKSKSTKATKTTTKKKTKRK